MTFNSQAIIQDARLDFEKMIDFVNGEEARAATADHIERGIFKMVLALGAKLLTVFFVMRSQTSSREAIKRGDGQKIPYHRDTKREYFSIFGKVELFRPYFYRKGMGGQIPLDGELSLGEDCYSDLVREITEYLGVESVYHKTGAILERLLGLQLSSRVVEANIVEDGENVEAYYAQKAAPLPGSEAEILVLQADGKGVPMILDQPVEESVRLGKGEKRGHKKEAIVTTVYTIAPKPRTPADVVANLFKEEAISLAEKIVLQHIQPQNKHIWATLEGKDTALERLSKQVERRKGMHILHQVALCDGCEALQSRIARQFPDFTLVLDFIHADEYLWDVANSLFGENNPQRIGWMKGHTLQILSGQTRQVIDEFHRLALADETHSAQRIQLNKTANYFERNLSYMEYQIYLANGWPIASGVIEGACRHFVKDRCELSGMRWSQAGAESLLHLRAVAENADWDAYHHFRRQKRHTRLYPSPFQALPTLENQALDSAVLPFPPSQPLAIPAPSQKQSICMNDLSDYQKLPLAV